MANGLWNDIIILVGINILWSTAWENELSPILGDFMYTHTHTWIHTYNYIYIYRYKTCGS